jgi:hypothetical protein
MPEETKKKSSKKKWLYAGGALAGLAVLGALAAWLLGRKKAGPPPPHTTYDAVMKARFGLPEESPPINELIKQIQDWGLDTGEVPDEYLEAFLYNLGLTGKVSLDDLKHLILRTEGISAGIPFEQEMPPDVARSILESAQGAP